MRGYCTSNPANGVCDPEVHTKCMVSIILNRADEPGEPKDPLWEVYSTALVIPKNHHDSNPNTMHMPQAIVDLVVDQLSLSTYYEAKFHLEAASLVSAAWVNRSQHHLFSTVEFYGGRKLKKWCSRIEPDPYGVLRWTARASRGVRMSPLQDPTPTDQNESPLVPWTSTVDSEQHDADVLPNPPTVVITSLKKKLKLPSSRG